MLRGSRRWWTSGLALAWVGVACGAIQALAVACGGGDADPSTPPLVESGAEEATPPEAAVPRDPLNACRAYITAQCEKQLECGEGSTERFEEQCLAFNEYCPEYQLAEGSTRTVESLFACADAFRALSCTDYHNGRRPACESPGTKPPGASCRFPAECAAKECVVSGPRGGCGTCASVAEAGAACNSSVVCADGFECTGTCIPLDASAGGSPCTAATRCRGSRLSCRSGSPGADAGTCELPGQLGAACNYRLGERIGECEAPNRCVPVAPGSTQGTCVPPAEPGEPCGAPGSGTAAAQCKDGYCPAPADGTTRCAPFQKEGETCDAKLFCDPERAECVAGRCTSYPRPGEDCTIGSGAGRCVKGARCAPFADAGLRCIADPAPGLLGDPCDPPRTTCVVALECVAGSCQKREYAACPVDAAADAR